MFVRIETKSFVKHSFYVVVEPTHLKNMLIKLDHFPR